MLGRSIGFRRAPPCVESGDLRPASWPYPRTMAQPRRRRGSLAIGFILILVGLVWTLQGLGYLAGSAMTGVTLWAIVGPIVAIIGVVLVVHRSRRS